MSYRLCFTKSLTVNTQKSEVMCFNCRPGSFLPLLFFDGVQLPYSDTLKYLGMVCDRQMNLDIAADADLRPFMAGTFRVKQFVKSHDLANKLHAHIWLSKLEQFLLACMRVRYGLLPSYDKVERWIHFTKMAFGSAEKDS